MDVHNGYIFAGWWSYLFDGDDTNEKEGLLEDFSDGFAEDDPAFHVLVTYNPVLLVVLLHLHTNLIDEVSDLVDG